MQMKKKPALIVLACVMAYLACFLALRSYSAIYAPHAWNRGYKTANPTQCSIPYPVFTTRNASVFRRFEERQLRRLAYYVFTPLVEWDLSIHNHPMNSLPMWTFYGNNWPK
jgi:hypothetical protein